MAAQTRHEFGALRAGLETALGEPGAATPEVLGALRRLTAAVRSVARRTGREDLLQLDQGQAEHDARDVRDHAQRLLLALQSRVAETDDQVLLVSADVVLAELLQREGRRIERTVDPAWARRRLGAGELSALVLDLDLPGQDGLELLVALQDLGEHAPATLVLSCRSDLLTRTECMALGARFLHKPHPPGLVEASLEAALLGARLAP